jgi:hypothetical protein
MSKHNIFASRAFWLIKYCIDLSFWGEKREKKERKGKEKENSISIVTNAAKLHRSRSSRHIFSKLHFQRISVSCRIISVVQFFVLRNGLAILPWIIWNFLSKFYSAWSSFALVYFAPKSNAFTGPSRTQMQLCYVLRACNEWYWIQWNRMRILSIQGSIRACNCCCTRIASNQD